MEVTTIFGNRLPNAAVAKARRTFRRYAARFKHDPQWIPELVSLPQGTGHEIFGIRSILEVGSAAERAAEDADKAPIDTAGGLVLGTIRMGFGHYRIALALASAAHALGYTPYWLDFLAFPGSTPSRLIEYLERLYNLGSRLSQRSRLFNRWFWEPLTSDMARRLSYAARDIELSRLYAPICRALPPETAFVSTHPWNGLAAVRAGLRNVVTVIPDNYPMAFHLVEGSTHTVQTPSSYFGYRTLRNMGENGQELEPLPEDRLFLAGNYVDHEIVENVEADCERRMRRIRERRTRRVLLTMGGAGAQVARFREIAVYCKAAVETGKAALLINMGDHEGRWNELKAAFARDGVQWNLHDDWPATRAFCEEILDGDVRGVHVFLHRDIFAAVYTTNLLMRAADLMVTKPSELSFYPIPKLFIQRVGRHETWGAIHSSEIGDGTLETESRAGMFQTLRIVIDHDDLLTLYCSNILKNKAKGVYNGAYEVVRIATGRSGTTPP